MGVSDENTQRDQHWMMQAIACAQTAKQQGEIPIGAVIVDANNCCIGQGWNQPIKNSDPSAHAEIIALRAAAQTIKNYRLINTTLYVTIEPCVMCVGALIHARIKRLVYGADDPRAGAIKSVFQINESRKLNHQIECTSGICAPICSELMKQFFKNKR